MGDFNNKINIVWLNIEYKGIKKQEIKIIHNYWWKWNVYETWTYRILLRTDYQNFK
jgi:hypothetical protein